MAGGSDAGLHAERDLRRRLRRRRVFFSVRPAAEAVFEVDAVVLDRLALELLGDTRVEASGEIAVEAERGRERGGVRRVLAQRAQRDGAQLRGRVGREEMRASVDRVDGLPRLIVRLGACRA